MSGKRFTTAARRLAVHEFHEMSPRPSHAEFARGLGVAAKTFGRWVQTHAAKADGVARPARVAWDSVDELARLRSENAGLRQANEVLAEGITFLATRVARWTST